MDKEITKNSVDYIVACNHAITEQSGMVSAIGIFDEIRKTKEKSVQTFYVVGKLNLVSQNDSLKGKVIRVEIVNKKLDKALEPYIETEIPDSTKTKKLNFNLKFTFLPLESGGEYNVRISLDKDIFYDQLLFFVKEE